MQFVGSIETIEGSLPCGPRSHYVYVSVDAKPCRNILGPHAAPDQTSQPPIADKKLPTAFPLLEIHLQQLPTEMDSRTHDRDRIVDGSQSHSLPDISQGADKYG